MPTPHHYAHTACLLRSCISDTEHELFYEQKKDEIGGFPALEALYADIAVASQDRYVADNAEETNAYEWIELCERMADLTFNILRGEITTEHALNVSIKAITY